MTPRLGRFLGIGLIAVGLLLPTALLLRSVVFSGQILTPAAGVQARAHPWRALPPGERRPEPANPELTEQFTRLQPWATECIRRLRDGDSPLWNPLAGLGAPLLTHPGSTLLAPWNVIRLLAGPARARGFLAVASILLAAVGTYLLLRALSSSRGAALFGATALSLSGPLVVRIGSPESQVAAWLPLTLFLVERLVSRPTCPRAGLLGLAAGMIWLGGRFETATPLMLAAATYAGARLVIQLIRGQRRAAGRAALLLLIALLLGTGLGGPYLAPASQLVDHLPAAPEMRTLPAEAAITLLLPRGFGSPLRDTPEYAGPRRYGEVCAYLGVLPLLFLALGALGHGYRRAEWWLAFTLLVVATGNAFGGAWAVRAVLPAAMASAIPASAWLFVLALAAALLAALGADTVFGPHPDDPDRPLSLRPAALAAGGLALLGLVAGLAALVIADRGLTFRTLFGSTRTADTGGQWIYFSALVAVGLILTLLRRKERIRPELAFGILWAMAAIDLTWTHRSYNPSLPAARFDKLVEAAAPPESLRNQSPPARFIGYGDTLPPCLGQLYGLNDLRIDAVEAPRAYRDLWDLAVVTAGDAGGETRTIGSPLLDLFSARYLLTHQRLGGAVGAVVGAGPGEARFVAIDLRSAAGGGRASLFTRLEHASELEQGAPVAEVVVRAESGADRTFTLRAGVDTAEGAPPRAEEPTAHQRPEPALERWVRSRGGASRRVERVFRTELDLRSLEGRLEVMEVQYGAGCGRLHLERFSPGTERPDTPWGKGGRLELRHDGVTLIYENTGSLPRARLVFEPEVIPDRASRLERLIDPGFDPASAVILESAFDFSSLPAVPRESPPPRGPSGVRILRYRAAEVELEAWLEADGFLVLSDLHLPGWHAFVDGLEWPLLRADHALRAVPLPRGGSKESPLRVHLRYVPPGFRPGLWAALAAGLGLIFLLLYPQIAARWSRLRPSKDTVS